MGVNEISKVGAQILFTPLIYSKTNSVFVTFFFEHKLNTMKVLIMIDTKIRKEKKQTKKSTLYWCAMNFDSIQYGAFLQ